MPEAVHGPIGPRKVRNSAHPLDLVPTRPSGATTVSLGSSGREEYTDRRY